MAINPQMKPLLADGRLTAQDLGQLEQLAARGAVSGRDVAALGQRYADALDAGVGAGLTQLARKLGAGFAPEAPIADLSGAPSVRNGLTVLTPETNRRHPGVRVVQRALVALANRTQRADLMLPNWGADGDYGSETQAAVRAFQASVDLEPNGKMDGRTAQKLDAALRATNAPAVFGPGGVAKPGPAMVKAAQHLVDEYADKYGVDDAWRNLDPNHALPANVRLGGTIGSWKCNLFAGNAVYLAGYEPPYYGNRGGGEYPNANQLYLWSDAHAAKKGNKVHFDLVAELPIEQIEDASGADRMKATLTKLLAKAEPGDLIIVDHRGDEVADGGHCRVVMSNDLGADGRGTIACAQASRDKARIRDETLSRFTGEETLWILRPNRPRRQNVA